MKLKRPLTSLKTREIIIFIHGKIWWMCVRIGPTYILLLEPHIASIATYALLFHRSLHSLEQTRQGKTIFVLLAGSLFRCWDIVLMKNDPVFYSTIVVTVAIVLHRVSLKKPRYLIADNFGKCWPILIFFFTLGLSSDYVMNWSLRIPSHLKRVATLPCETSVQKLI